MLITILRSLPGGVTGAYSKKIISIENRGQTDRIVTPTRCISLLPLASAAPRRTPRCANAQLMTLQWKSTNTAINKY